MKLFYCELSHFEIKKYHCPHFQRPCWTVSFDNTFTKCIALRQIFPLCSNRDIFILVLLDSHSTFVVRVCLLKDRILDEIRAIFSVTSLHYTFSPRRYLEDVTYRSHSPAISHRIIFFLPLPKQGGLKQTKDLISLYLLLGSS